jgi:hypothetical protein
LIVKKSALRQRLTAELSSTATAFSPTRGFSFL